jgi:catechol 2,3-dioxygenase-like lactoylglutathione lyase family enzyme
MMLKINSFQHLGIPVTDLKRSEQFYESLGFENVMSSPFEENADIGHVSMMEKSGMIIEIYQLPAAALSEIRTRKEGHIDHIAFDVDDIDATFSELKNRSFKVLEEQPVFLPFWENGCKYFTILGPDGERLEFNQIL